MSREFKNSRSREFKKARRSLRMQENNHCVAKRDSRGLVGTTQPNFSFEQCVFYA